MIELINKETREKNKANLYHLASSGSLHPSPLPLNRGILSIRIFCSHIAQLRIFERIWKVVPWLLVLAVIRARSILVRFLFSPLIL